jgi:hypothetical protein
MNVINVTYNSIKHYVLMPSSSIYTDETTGDHQRGFVRSRPNCWSNILNSSQSGEKTDLMPQERSIVKYSCWLYYIQ